MYILFSVMGLCPGQKIPVAESDLRPDPMEWLTWITKKYSQLCLSQIHISRIIAYTTAKKKRPNQLGYLVGIWL